MVACEYVEALRRLPLTCESGHVASLWNTSRFLVDNRGEFATGGAYTGPSTVNDRLIASWLPRKYCCRPTAVQEGFSQGYLCIRTFHESHTYLPQSAEPETLRVKRNVHDEHQFTEFAPRRCSSREMNRLDKIRITTIIRCRTG